MKYSFKNWLIYLGIFCSLIMLIACQPKHKTLEVIDKPLTRTESLLHTVVQLSIYHDNQEKAMEEAIDYLKRMEATLSTNLEGSDVYKINQSAGKNPVKVSKETFDIIEASLDISKTSQGKFDISIGAVSNLWKIGSEDARVPSQEELVSAIKQIDYRKIQLDKEKQTVYIEEGMTLELGAISKGYIADGVRELFLKRGIHSAIINLGGNVLVLGTSPKNEEGWNIGVQNPDEVRGDTVGAVLVKDSSVVTSGIYERYLEANGKTYHHILNPETGYPVENEISGVTVFTKNSLQGDQFSTTLYLLGIQEGLELINKTEGVEAVFIDKDKGIHLSEGLKEKFTLKNEEYHLVNKTN